MRTAILVTATVIALVSGCAVTGVSTIGTLAPKFTGQTVETMTAYFGAPERVSSAGSLTFYEWRIGEYGTELDRINGHVSGGGNVSGTVERGATQFRGCIVKAMVNEDGTVAQVTTESRQGRFGEAYSLFGCGEVVDDPFEALAAAQAKRAAERAKLDQSSQLTVGMTADQVREIMGKPVEQLLVHGMQEWHYCATGDSQDNFVTAYLKGGELQSTSTYTVTLADTGGITGHCKRFVRQGSYRLPETITQSRSE